MTPREFLTFILDKLRPYRDRWVSPVSFLIAVVIHLLIISLGTSHYTGASSHPERSNQAVQNWKRPLRTRGSASFMSRTCLRERTSRGCRLRAPLFPTGTGWAPARTAEEGRRGTRIPKVTPRKGSSAHRLRGRLRLLAPAARSRAGDRRDRSRRSRPPPMNSRKTASPERLWMKLKDRAPDIRNLPGSGRRPRKRAFRSRERRTEEPPARKPRGRKNILRGSHPSSGK